MIHVRCYSIWLHLRWQKPKCSMRSFCACAMPTAALPWWRDVRGSSWCIERRTTCSTPKNFERGKRKRTERTDRRFLYLNETGIRIDPLDFGFHYRLLVVVGRDTFCSKARTQSDAVNRPFPVKRQRGRGFLVARTERRSGRRGRAESRDPRRRGAAREERRRPALSAINQGAPESGRRRSSPGWCSRTAAALFSDAPLW